MSPFTPPPDYHRIKVVHSFDELIATLFGDGINALCWQRELPGNFGEIVNRVRKTGGDRGEGITPIEDSWLENLDARPAGRVAVELLLEDECLLRAHGSSPPAPGL